VLNLYLCYFLTFVVSFGVLVICKSFRENSGFKVKLQRKRTVFFYTRIEASFQGFF